MDRSMWRMTRMMTTSGVIFFIMSEEVMLFQAEVRGRRRKKGGSINKCLQDMKTVYSRKNILFLSLFYLLRQTVFENKH